eukprot:4632324-Pyramimonas_sp.AAC.1
MADCARALSAGNMVKLGQAMPRHSRMRLDGAKLSRSQDLGQISTTPRVHRGGAQPTRRQNAMAPAKI